MKLERITKKCGRFEFEDYQTEIKTLIERAISEYDQVVAMQSQYDLMISDLLHKVEEENMGAVELVKWAVKIRDIQRERRLYKAKQQYLYRFVGLLKDHHYQGQLNKMFNKALLQYGDQPYKPRVIKEEKQ